jgi:glycosyltransferase involved in cell wall biosynthesis
MTPTALDHQAQRRAVALVTPDPGGRGGMAAVVRGMLSSPLARRYDLTAITTHGAGSATRRLLAFSGGLVRLAAWCLRHPGGLVHVHAAVRGSFYRKALVIVLARALRHPVLLQVHAGPGDIEAFATRLSHGRRRFLRAAMRRAQAVVSVSAASAETMEQAFGLPTVGVLTNAVPLPPDDVPPPNARRALFLGGFEDPAKGGMDLLDALPRLLSLAPQLELVLAGPGEPPLALVQASGGRAVWYGWLDAGAKRRELDACGIVVMPSRSEGQPIVLLEAMAHGRAVVATSVGGIPDTLADGVEGILVPPQDGAALAAAVASLANDPQRLAAVAAAARRRASSVSAESGYERVAELYERLWKR